MMNIGILTWHNHHNFGGALQSYALLESLKRFGDVRVEIINYDCLEKGVLDIAKDSIKLFLTNIGQINNLGNEFRYYYPFLLFESKYQQLGKHINTMEELKNYSKKFDVVICGSDQIWAPNVFKSVYMLDFVFAPAQKVSYAASIGLNDIDNSTALLYKELLKDFYAISVREKCGKKILLERCGIDSRVVLDPTFLLPVDLYAKIEKKIEILKNEKYVFCYFLKEDNEYKNSVMKYAKKHNLKIVGVSRKITDYNWMKSIGRLGPCEFLWLIHNSEIVFTDSYHGTIFSLIYHKNFFTFERFTYDEPICQNSRLDQLRDYFDIDNRIIKQNLSVFIDNVFDYTEFENKLGILRSESWEYLRRTIEC